jgi:hypothetical protein
MVWVIEEEHIERLKLTLLLFLFLSFIPLFTFVYIYAVYTYQLNLCFYLNKELKFLYLLDLLFIYKMVKPHSNYHRKNFRLQICAGLQFYNFCAIIQ